MPDTSRHARFRELVLPELEVLWRVGRRLTRSAEEPEDLLQETLLRAYRGLDGFDGRYPRAWLLTILRNTQANRARKRQPDLLDEEVANRLPAPGTAGRVDGVSEQAFHGTFDPLVKDALAALSPKHRAVIALVDLDGLSYQEAAEVLEVPVGTVMSRLHRARRKVREHLDELGFSEVER